MNRDQSATYTAFEGEKLLTRGPLDKVVLKVKQRIKTKTDAAVLVFSDLTGKEMDFDLRGSDQEVLHRLEVYRTPIPAKSIAPPGPGRPKLGVVAREISLLPRHWEWLATQTGGASATLRRLIEEARKNSASKDQPKQAQERTYQFMFSIAGNFTGYEEALRALYAKDSKKFSDLTRDWPKDIREHLKMLSLPVFE